MKENLASIAVIAVGVFTLLGVAIKSVVDYSIGIRATRSAELISADKKNEERTAALELRVDSSWEKLLSMESQLSASERALSMALNRVDRLESANKDLIAQNEQLKIENASLEKKVKQLQDRCAELEVHVTKNSEAISNTGS